MTAVVEKDQAQRSSVNIERDTEIYRDIERGREGKEPYIMFQTQQQRQQQMQHYDDFDDEDAIDVDEEEDHKITYLSPTKNIGIIIKNSNDDDNSDSHNDYYSNEVKMNSRSGTSNSASRRATGGANGNSRRATGGASGNGICGCSKGQTKLIKKTTTKKGNNMNNNNNNNVPWWWKFMRRLESFVPMILLSLVVSTVWMLLTLHEQHTENGNILPEYPTERDMKSMLHKRHRRPKRTSNSHVGSSGGGGGGGGLTMEEYSKLLDPKKVARAREQQLRIQKLHQKRIEEAEEELFEEFEKDNANREANNTYYYYKPPTFELPTNYRSIPKKWYEGTANKTIPSWMKHYFDWHVQQIVNLTSDNWQSDNRKYLVLRCYRKDGRCGGLSDRLKPVPLLVLAANISQRILFIHWDRPVALEEFLVPPDNGIQWRVPTWMDQHMHDITKALVPRASQLLSKVMNANQFMIHSHLHDARGGMTQYEEYFNNTSEFYDIFHDLFRLFFEPSKPLQYAMEEKLLGPSHHNHHHNNINNNSNNNNSSHYLNPYGHLLLHEQLGKYSVVHYRAEYGHEVQRHPVLTQPSFLRRAVMNAIRCASELQPMIEMKKKPNSSTINSTTESKRTMIISNILQQPQRQDEQEENERLNKHNQKFSENYPTIEQQDKSLSSSSSSPPPTDPSYLPLIYFASDNPIAMQVARNVAKQTNYPIIVFDRDEAQPLHLDYYGEDPNKPKNDTNSDAIDSSVAVAVAVRPPPTSNMPSVPRAKDYYSTFIDLYLAGNGKCVSFGRGGFGRFASLLSYDASCNIKHTAKFWPAVCHGAGVFHTENLSKYGKDLSDPENQQEGIGVDPLLDGVEEMM